MKNVSMTIDRELQQPIRKGKSIGEKCLYDNRSRIVTKVSNVIIKCFFFLFFFCFFFFSSPEPKAQDERLRMSCCDLIASVVRPFTIWTTSPLKPLGQFSSKFMWSLLLKWDLKFYKNGHGLLITVAASPIYGKIVKKLLQNQESFKSES